MRHGALLGMVVMVAACGGGDGGSGTPDASAPDASRPDGAAPAVDAVVDASAGDAAVPTGAYHHYVLRRLLIPRTPAEKTAFGLNIDGDPADVVDNALGGLLQFLGTQGFAFQASIDAAIAAGQVVQLHSMRADDLASDDSVSWQVFLGDASAAPPAFDGADTFTVSASSPTPPAILLGAIAGGLFRGGPGTIAVELPLPSGATATLHLVGARIATTEPVSDGAAVGKLGGGVLDSEVDAVLLPAMAVEFTAVLVGDGCAVTGGMCVCPMGSNGATLEAFGLDPNHDCLITAAELMANAAISAFLAPDIDLLDCGGAMPQTCDPATSFRPRTDSVNDALSLGVRIELVKARFVAPGE